MTYQQSFTLTSSLTASKLQEEIGAILSSSDPLDVRGVTFAEYTVTQKAGTGIEAAVIIFTSKVAYDIWRELILPRLKAKYGGAAVTPTSDAVEK